jgi:alpha-1,6-mannosyltransferase
VVPGARHADEQTAAGRVITLPGPVLPRTGGYRVLADPRRVARLLDRLGPDRLEVSDRATLRWTGRWARAHGVGSAMVSHECLTGLLDQWGLLAARRVADRLNLRTARSYGRIVCTTRWAAEEFHRIGASNVDLVPLGVDLEGFHPSRRDPELRARYAADGEVLLVHCSRLSVEKRPHLAVDALAELRRAGVPAVLVVAGTGPLRPALERQAAGLPVHFAGFLAGRRSPPCSPPPTWCSPPARWTPAGRPPAPGPNSSAGPPRSPVSSARSTPRRSAPTGPPTGAETGSGRRWVVGVSWAADPGRVRSRHRIECLHGTT